MSEENEIETLHAVSLLPQEVRFRIYSYAVCCPTTKEELVEAVDRYMEKNYVDPLADDSFAVELQMMGDVGLWPVQDSWSHPIGNWDVSRVRDFSHLFSEHRNPRNRHFNEDISIWNVSNSTNFSSMFAGCSLFNQDVSKWNVSKATDLSYMFFFCEKFDSDVSKWDVSSAQNLSCMFYHCRVFASDVSKWDVSKANDLRGMFACCVAFYSNVSEWNIINASEYDSVYTDVNERSVFFGMFSYCSWFHEEFVSGWNITTEQREDMFSREGVFGFEDKFK